MSAREALNVRKIWPFHGPGDGTSAELTPGHIVWPVLKVTLRPKGGLPMVVNVR